MRSETGAAVALVQRPVALLAEEATVAGCLAAATDAELAGLPLQAAARRIVALVVAATLLIFLNHFAVGIVILGDGSICKLFDQVLRW